MIDALFGSLLAALFGPARGGPVPPATPDDITVYTSAPAYGHKRCAQLLLEDLPRRSVCHVVVVAPELDRDELSITPLPQFGPVAPSANTEVAA